MSKYMTLKLLLFIFKVSKHLCKICPSCNHFRTRFTNCSARLNSPTSGRFAVEPGLLILLDIADVENIGPTRLAAGVTEPLAKGLSGFFLRLYRSMPVRQIF